MDMSVKKVGKSADFLEKTLCAFAKFDRRKFPSSRNQFIK